MPQIEIPSELPIVLRNFTLSVLRTKPRDIIDHAVDYFTQLQQQQQQQSKLMTDDIMVTTGPYSLSPSIIHHEKNSQASLHNTIFSGQ